MCSSHSLGWAAHAATKRFHYICVCGLSQDPDGSLEHPCRPCMRFTYGNSKGIFKGALHPGHSVNKWFSISSVAQIPFFECLKNKGEVKRQLSLMGARWNEWWQCHIVSLWGPSWLCNVWKPRNSSCRRMNKDSSREQFYPSYFLSDTPPTSEKCGSTGFKLGLQLQQTIIFMIVWLIVIAHKMPPLNVKNAHFPEPKNVCDLMGWRKDSAPLLVAFCMSFNGISVLDILDAQKMTVGFKKK